MEDRVSFREFVCVEMMFWYMKLKLLSLRVKIRCQKIQLWLIRNCW